MKHTVRDYVEATAMAVICALLMGNYFGLL